MHLRCLVVLLGLSLSACGGGGGGGSSPAANKGQLPADTTTASDGRSRQVNATCPFTQVLSAARNDSRRIERVSWVQTAEFDATAPNVQLIANKPVLARVDLLTTSSSASPSRAFLLVSNAGACTRLALTSPASIPTEVDRQTLNSAYSVTIPANLVEPGSTVAVVFDDDQGRSASEADQTYRLFQLPVRSSLTETIRVIPITYKGQSGFVTSNKDLTDFMVRLHPITGFALSTEAAFAPPSLNQSVLGLLVPGQESFLTMQAVLSELDDECARRNGAQTSARTAPKCLGVFPNNLTFRSATGQVVGLAFVGGVSMLAQSVSATDDFAEVSAYGANHWLNFRALTVAHEYGHLLNLDHAACGGPTDTDPRLYADGRLGGGAGYDPTRKFYFSSQRLNNSGQPQFGDLMSYCAKEWSSDRGYVAALNYRAGPSARLAAQDAGARSQWLKITAHGGRWQLRPVDFTPSTLRVTNATLQAVAANGVTAVPVYAAVIADAPELTQGPFFADVGNLNPLRLTLLGADSAGGLPIQWSAQEWIKR
jgi:hypothetical protein